jgi:hypothetical protein
MRKSGARRTARRGNLVIHQREILHHLLMVPESLFMSGVS